LYVVQDRNKTALLEDALPDGSPSPWVDGWAAVVEKRFNTWFANFSAIGGTVDVVLLDFEAGGKVYW
jgi:hypothetical protein